MSKEFFSAVPSLHGDRVALRRITREDAAALALLVSDPAVYKMLPTFLTDKWIR